MENIRRKKKEVELLKSQKNQRMIEKMQEDRLKINQEKKDNLVKIF